MADAEGKAAGGRQQRSREEVMAEREARKKEKEARKTASIAKKEADDKAEAEGKKVVKKGEKHIKDNNNNNNSNKESALPSASPKRENVVLETPATATKKPSLKENNKHLSVPSSSANENKDKKERRESAQEGEKAANEKGGKNAHHKKERNDSEKGSTKERRDSSHTEKSGSNNSNKERRDSAQTSEAEDRSSFRKDSDKGRRAPPSHSRAVMLQFDDPKKYARHSKKAVVAKRRLEKQVPLFSHLPQYERDNSLSLQVGLSGEDVHPAFVRLGLKMAERSISGSNARCVALLNAFKELINDYVTPPSKVLALHLHSALKPLIRFLIDCRPLSISMGNAIRYVKHKIAQIKDTVSEEDAKRILIEQIDNFIESRIEVADQAIVNYGVSRIADGDVILTYAKSHVVEMLLKKAHDEGKQFRVIVADSRPLLEGKELTRHLVKYGVKCTYILISTLPYVIQEVSKVFLGAAAIFANGAVLSRVGSAVTAMMAHRHNIPLLVCCETYKMHERVQLDSICFNELGDPDDLIKTERDDTRFGDVLTEWRDLQKLKLLNLNYDLIPSEFVSMVVTEVGMIPPTSVPVILREYHKEGQED